LDFGGEGVRSSGKRGSKRVESGGVNAFKQRGFGLGNSLYKRWLQGGGDLLFSKGLIKEKER